MCLRRCLFILLMFKGLVVFGQKFERFPSEIISGEKKLTFRKLHFTSKGTLLVSTSAGLMEIENANIEFQISHGELTDADGNISEFKNANILKDLYHDHSGIKVIEEGPEQIMYLVSDNNHFGWMNYKVGKGIGVPPFNFPDHPNINIRNIWFDPDGDLFVASLSDTFYFIKDVTKLFETTSKGDLKPTFKGNDTHITEGARPVARVILERGTFPYSFAYDTLDHTIWIGTNKGIYLYNKQRGQSEHIIKPQNGEPLTVTHIDISNHSVFNWFSTLEKGMGSYNNFTKAIQFYPYTSRSKKPQPSPIQTFSRLSASTFLVAPSDSLPALFNKETGAYKFITNAVFDKSKNSTTDIKTDDQGILYVIKGGDLFYSKDFLKTIHEAFGGQVMKGPYIMDLTFNGESYRNKHKFYDAFESLKKLQLEPNENSFNIVVSRHGFTSEDTVMYIWKMDGYTTEWKTIPLSVADERMNMVSFENLKPGTYIFRLKMKKGSKQWMKEQVALTIVIRPHYWQTAWFWSSIAVAIGLLFYVLNQWSVNTVRRKERLKAQHEKELLELEAKALRAQMNPHFIFNSMNSIKALMQQGAIEKAIEYLTTFSKLIRTIFNNSDKRQVTLFDELETCRLYLQLESMRFGVKLQHAIEVDKTIDLKSIEIPALIIQPFIENAVWHGLMPKENGGKVTVSVNRADQNIICAIEDTGIGRKVSLQNKAHEALHQSKGLHLTQSRLNLENSLDQVKTHISIIDKEGPDGTSTGTLVKITLHTFV
jgi:hypothetical protein